MKNILFSLSLALLAGTFEAATAQVPVITTQPAFACKGGDVTFTITATNNPTAYNWEYSTTFGVWTAISDDAIYSGSSTATLLVHSDIGGGARYYRGYAVNASGSSLPSQQAALNTVIPDQPIPITGNFYNYLSSFTNTVCQGISYVYFETGVSRGSEGIGSLGYIYNWSYSGSDVTVPGYPGYFYDTSEVLSFGNHATSGSISVTASNGCGTSLPQTLAITVNPLQPGVTGSAAGTCAYYPVMTSGPTTYLEDGTCTSIATVQPAGTHPVFGAVYSCVILDPAVQSFNGIPYVPRHYALEPANLPGISTATVTLYFTQADFDAYNAARGSNPALPTGPFDAAGIANLHITQFHGTGTTPDTYVGGSGDIVPSPGNVVWNVTASRWEVTFDITGFSGFFVSGGSLVPLPLTLVDFTGKATTDGNLLQWVTASEENTAYFEVERKSGDGTAGSGSAGSAGFQPLATLPAAGNSHRNLDYSYTDESANGLQGALSYRLHIVDLDGKSTYSKIVVLQPAVSNLSIRILPNPSHQPLTLTVSTPQSGPAALLVTDIGGRSIGKQLVALQKGENSLDPQLIATLPKGVYFISVTTDVQKQTVKFIRE